MKKIIIILMLLLLPMSMFGQFFLGASALYKGDPLGIPSITPDPSIVDNLAFGADIRVNLAIFEAQALALYNLDQSFNCYFDLGIVLNIAIVSIGAGVGPNFVVSLASGTPEPFAFGFNGKIHADINLGSFKISAYYMFLIDNISIPDITSQMYAGNVGLSLMFKLFG
ncbi:MAG: hypothetical protein JXD23_05405 [Spirochaetales bacterium]|nr:hypothetical protein [Spirochaetales bacterium]